MILKVSANTEIVSLRTSIIGYLNSHRTVCLDCIGEKANYAATKAVMHAQKEFANRTIDIVIKPIMLDTPDGERARHTVGVEKS